MTRPLVLVDARKARDLGIGRHVVGLVSALSLRDEHELAVIARPDDQELFPKRVRFLPDRSGHYSLEELLSVRAAITKLGPGLFHAPHYVVPLRPPCPAVVTIHDLMHLTRPEHAGPARRIYASVMIGRAVRLARRVITVSMAVREQIAHRYPKAAERIRVIPNGVDARFSAAIPEASRRDVRARHGLPDRYLLCLGNDKPHKNLEGLLAVWARLRRQSRAPELVLAGGDPERAASRRDIVARLAGGGGVFDLGRVPDADVPPLLAEAAALVVPSLDEGFGLPVVEAQACGTPVACSTRGGLPEAAGGAALLFDPTDADAVAAALQRILTDASLRADLVARGLRNAASLSWSRVAAETASVYREVLSGARS